MQIFQYGKWIQDQYCCLWHDNYLGECQS